MVHISIAGHRFWQPTLYQGVQLAWLWQNERGGASAMLQLDAGATLPLHMHAGWEQVFVIKGRLRINQHELGACDHLQIPAHTVHRVFALQDTLYLALSEKQGIDFVEEDSLLMQRG